MLTTHRADVDCLDTSYSTVVLELYAGEIAQGIRHGKGVETLQFFAFEGLRNDDILGQGTRSHLDFLNMEVVIQTIRLALREDRQGTKCKKYD